MPIDVAFINARKCSVQLQNVLSTGQTLIKMVEMQEDWSWAANHKKFKDLKEMYESLETATTPFMHELTINDNKRMKELYEEPQLLMLLSKMPIQVGSKIDNLKKKIDTLKALHTINVNDDRDMPTQTMSE